jgi:hypothetical protein
MKRILAIIPAFVLPIAALAQQPTSQDRGVPAFDLLKSLQGEWEGKAIEGGKEVPATTVFKLVSGGTVLMDDLAPGTPHEMITMFHRDGEDLLATHYCLLNNQPRMRAVATSEPNVVAFEFKDATNLASPRVAHMGAVKFTILDSNHHAEDWTVIVNGQSSTRRFDFYRKQ